MYRKPITVFLLTLITAFVLITGISIHAVETALTQRLRLSDREVAHAMAIGLSRPLATLEDAQSLIDAHFALGRYNRIRLLDAQGHALYARERIVSANQNNKADNRLFWLWTLQPREQLPAATAAVKSNVLGISHVSVQSELVFDHHASETWFLRLLTIFSVIAVAGTAIIVRAKRQTASAIRELQSGIAGMLDADSPALPAAPLPEFEPVYSSTVQMTQRIAQRNLKALEQVEMLNRMRRTDPATGLLNRESFSTKLSQSCESLPPSKTGHILLIRLLNLQAMNTLQGRQQVDALLAQLGRNLNQFVQTQESMACGRITGTEIALLTPNAEKNLLLNVREPLQSMLAGSLFETRIDDIQFARGEKSEDILRRCELNQSESRFVEHDNSAQRDIWYERLTWGLAQHHFFLQAFPLVDAQGQDIHREHYLRLSERKSGTVHPGGTLMAWAEHLNLAAEIDLEVVNLAFNAAAENTGRVCINLSAAALMDPVRREALIADLQQAPRYCNRIDIDIAEDFAATHTQDLKVFTGMVESMGIRVGIDHLDAYAGNLMQLRSSGARYIKVAAALTGDLLDAQRGRERARLLSELVHSAHSLSMLVFAENVTQPALVQALFDLDFDGVSGPAVGNRSADVPKPEQI